MVEILAVYLQFSEKSIMVEILAMYLQFSDNIHYVRDIGYASTILW